MLKHRGLFCYNIVYMNRGKQILYFLIRMDVLNRILVFISMAFLIVEPSWILYSIGDSGIEEILPCLFMLGIVIGNGLLTLYKPIRTSWFYFLSVLFAMALNYKMFLDSPIDELVLYRNAVGIYVTMLVYNGIGLLINLIFFAQSLHRNLHPKTFNEKTNEDNPYDFLNARNINKDVEKKVMNIVPDNEPGKFVKTIRKIKFSRYSRVASFALSFIVMIYCLYKSSTSAISLASPITVYGLIVLSVLVAVSLIFPGDFKYIYYYDSILLGVLLICASKSDDIPLFWLVVNLIILILALLVTLITEGRTWMGATIDSD